ncbi:MAG: nicotinic acid mononucleotide adenylyltransferase [Novosphingobium sp. 28-62-57]|uniref:nicotinate-nucleotide adenylyltransferase n=1 Tax=unclassified Novosphingobium TaxID=2644732 RepID=UPI000BD15A60|nr:MULTISPECIES: nicotinate-nucleotide adenylyltransferase [unclassified Novosphingobium]OYW50481.1 MAG: nicotinic acid mononucleotide adenylyltransferase [Novosphingobium sp. 12-62-10]OYZ11704.1 MAG: nicotinic acid mononucleotide adenylyltransferase [Novosphingobium sp. 28-62-57]OZA37218.1 MAG: nicotinic acid mononucleotide adenylyltransferase [Novosphingobium sp. 17-62-9]HQS69825.1 nicotinate-nucleotide adenylyltransferase [Novosphingobium sp.]
MAGARIRAGKALKGPLTGLFGGSFNPAHGGHRRVSLFAMDALGLDEVWWLVSPGNVLKPVEGMAPLEARLASAQAMARRAPIRATAIERTLGTRFTIDTLRAIQRRYPKRRFVWIMGADNLAQFHRWKHWRQIARQMPIAVIARPGYDGRAMASPAMAWLRRWRQRPGQHVSGARRSAPALTLLRFDPDARSASAIRANDPDWAARSQTAGLRDAVTHRPISREKR